MAERPVIFDLDGTLIDSAPSIAEAANRMLAEFGRPPLSLAEITGFIGNGLPVLVRRVMAARGIAAGREAEAQAATLAQYRDTSLQEAHFYPGAVAALEALRAAGHPLAICTNKPEALAREILERSGILAMFATVIGGDTLPVRKPDPDPLHRALAACGGGRGLFVGDSEIDAETAHRAALPFLFFTGGYAKGPAAEIVASARFDRHDDLPGIVAKAI